MMMMIFVFLIWLWANVQPALGHWRGDDFTQPMLIVLFRDSIFVLKAIACKIQGSYFDGLEKNWRLISFFH